MRKNRIVILLVVVSFIIPGCLDSIDDSESNIGLYVNQEPIVYSWGQNFEYGIDGNGQVDYSVMAFSWQLSVIDTDGNISSVGIDTDLDGVIDYEFTSSNWSNPEQTFELPTSFTSYENATHVMIQDEYESCLFAFNIIAEDNDGAKSINPFTRNLYCEGNTDEDSHGNTDGDFSMYGFSVTDASGTPTADGSEDLVYVAMNNGDDLSWSTTIVQISADGGSYTECTTPGQTAGAGCAVTDGASTDGKWGYGEEVVVTEGTDSICDAPCTVQVKILDKASNKLIYESSEVTVD